MGHIANNPFDATSFYCSSGPTISVTFGNLSLAPRNDVYREIIIIFTRNKIRKSLPTELNRSQGCGKTKKTVFEQAKLLFSFGGKHLFVRLYTGESCKPTVCFPAL